MPEKPNYQNKSNYPTELIHWCSSTALNKEGKPNIESSEMVCNKANGEKETLQDTSTIPFEFNNLRISESIYCEETGLSLPSCAHEPMALTIPDLRSNEMSRRWCEKLVEVERIYSSIDCCPWNFISIWKSYPELSTKCCLHRLFENRLQILGQSIKQNHLNDAMLVIRFMWMRIESGYEASEVALVLKKKIRNR